MKISIIVPVYNVEKYIRKCLDSIIHQINVPQSFFEVVVVNDGSVDNSLTIIEEFRQHYSNISVLTQSNQGLSIARNNGLSIARGEYIWFIDSDDWIARNSLEILLRLTDEKKPDVIHFRAANSICDKLQIRTKKFVDIERSYTGIEIICQNIWDTCVPFYIYKRDFLEKNHLFFFPNIFHEDNEFTPRMLYYAQKVYLINDVLYNVSQNPQSITRSINLKKSFDLILISQLLYKFAMENISDKVVKLRFFQFIALNINNALYGTRYMNSLVVKKFNQELRQNKELFYCLSHSKIYKYTIEGYLFKLIPNYSFIYQLLNLLRFRRCK